MTKKHLHFSNIIFAVIASFILNSTPAFAGREICDAKAVEILKHEFWIDDEGPELVVQGSGAGFTGADNYNHTKIVANFDKGPHGEGTDLFLFRTEYAPGAHGKPESCIVTPCLWNPKDGNISVIPDWGVRCQLNI